MCHANEQLSKFCYIGLSLQKYYTYKDRQINERGGNLTQIAAKNYVINHLI